VIRRFLHIIIATTLLLSTSGVTVTAYFCGDSLSGILIFPPSECNSKIKACCIKAEGKKKCCTSNSEFIQIDIDQLNYGIADVVDLDVNKLTPTIISQQEFTHIDKKVETLFLYRPPPLITDQIIEFQNFRC